MRIHLIDKNGIIFGQYGGEIIIYKIENEEMEEIRRISIKWYGFNENRNELKIKSENRIEAPYFIN